MWNHTLNQKKDKLGTFSGQKRADVVLEKTSRGHHRAVFIMWLCSGERQASFSLIFPSAWVEANTQQSSQRKPVWSSRVLESHWAFLSLPLLCVFVSFPHLQLLQHLESQQLLPKVISTLDNDWQEPPIGKMAIRGAFSDPPMKTEVTGWCQGKDSAGSKVWWSV